MMYYSVVDMTKTYNSAEQKPQPGRSFGDDFEECEAPQRDCLSLTHPSVLTSDLGLSTLSSTYSATKTAFDVAVEVSLYLGE